MSPAATSSGGRPLHWVVLGAAGQLGRALLTAGRSQGQSITGLMRTDVDVCDREAVIGALSKLHPDLVVNAAAYTAVDQAENDAARAFAVNRDGAAYVAEACAGLDVPMIHLSTDYVFDGNKPGSYRETDEAAPLSVYGLSKAAGEQLIGQRHTRSAIVRTSWLFGVDGRNFVKTIAMLASERDELRVVGDQRGCPTPTADLARAIFLLGPAMIAERAISGIFHFSGAEAISWHGLAEAIVQGMTPRLSRRPRVVAVATKDYPLPAPRPRNSALDCGKVARLGVEQRSWRPGLRAVVDELLRSDRPRPIETSRSMPCPIFS